MSSRGRRAVVGSVVSCHRREFVGHGSAAHNPLSLPGSTFDAKGPGTPGDPKCPPAEAIVTNRATIRARALRLLPALLTVAGVLVITFAALATRDQQNQRDALIQILEDSGLDERSPRLASLVRSDPDVYSAQERVAMALIADLLDPSSRSDAASPADLELQLESQIDRLAVAEQLGHDVLKVRPKSWRSSTAIGAAIYLRRSLRRDEDLLRSYQDWETPLLRAREIAPGRSETARFLTMAYLELWTVLSEEKRALTRALLEPSLRDRSTYLATIDAWLQVAGDDLEAVDRLPQESWVLKDVTQRLVRRGHLALALESHRRWNVALAEEAEAALDTAREASARGSHTRAAKVALPALASLPVQSQWLPLAERLLAAVPSGQLKHQSRFTHVWFDHELEQCLRSECRLSEEFVRRSLPMSGRDTRDRLVAALSLGDWEAMTQTETELESSDRCAAPIERYWLAKATRALREGRPETARDALTECPSSSEDLQLVQAQLLRAARRSSPNGSDVFRPAESTIVGTALSNGQEIALPPGDYEVTIAFTPRDNSLVDVLVDGGLVASVPLPPTDQVHAIRITSTGLAQSLRTVGVAGPVPGMQILNVTQVRSSSAR